MACGTCSWPPPTRPRRRWWRGCASSPLPAWRQWWPTWVARHRSRPTPAVRRGWRRGRWSTTWPRSGDRRRRDGPWRWRRRGAGKTMLARCLPGLLPPMTLEEALELAEVRSVLGELPAGRPLDWTRPFRAPHHSISTAGLVGGGSRLAVPGEVSRATRGVLFLDELAEFQPVVLQALRQPLEEGRVVITRSGGPVTYPAHFQLVAATNLCPCGWTGDDRRPCRCTPGAVQAYQRALSGPITDRIDLQVTVPRTPPEVLGREASGEPSRTVRARVERARRVQLE